MYASICTILIEYVCICFVFVFVFVFYVEQNLNHYIVHIETGSVLSIERRNININNNSDKNKNSSNSNGSQKDDSRKLDIKLRNESIDSKYSQWSYFEDGTIKNFTNSLCLGVICRQKKLNNDRNYCFALTYELVLIDSIRMKVHNLYNSETNSYNNDTSIISNDSTIVEGTKWDYDETNRTLRNQMCKLYLS